MPVLNQYRLQCWHATDVQCRASTDGQVPAKLFFGAVPVVSRVYASTISVLQILLRYWRGLKPVVNFHLGYYKFFLIQYTLCRNQAWRFTSNYRGCHLESNYWFSIDSSTCSIFGDLGEIFVDSLLAQIFPFLHLGES